MKSFVYRKIHLNVLGQRTTININVYLASLFLRKRTGERSDALSFSDTNVSTVRKLIQREIDQKNNSDIQHVYRKDRLKERVEEFLIMEIADPNLLN